MQLGCKAKADPVRSWAVDPVSAGANADDLATGLSPHGGPGLFTWLWSQSFQEHQERIGAGVQALCQPLPATVALAESHAQAQIQGAVTGPHLLQGDVEESHCGRARQGRQGWWPYL